MMFRRIPVVLICLLSITYVTAEQCKCERFGKFTNCSFLDLKQFTILDVPCAHAFRTLDLTGNFLEDYSEDIRHFRNVNLSSNALLRLDATEDQSVEVLDVSKNLIHQIDLGDNFQSLLSLNASENALGANENFLTGRCNLVQLDLSGNTIASLDTILKCTNLTVLIAARNGIVKLPSQLLSLEKLELLNLGKNRLKLVFNFPRTLKALHLYQNAISVLQASSFSNLTSLKLLNLEGNRISSISDKAFESLSSLELLDLTENKLTNISTATFRNLNSLMKLTLSNNDISFIPFDSFSDLGELRELDLDENLLTTIPKLRLGRKVHHVSLMMNLIQNMDVEALMTLFTKTLVPRMVIFVLNPLRGDDPGWVEIVENFGWRCADELIPLVEKFVRPDVLPSRYLTHKVLDAECPCAFFSKSLWSFGTCINDVPEVNGKHWIRAAEIILHDEL